MTEKWVGVYLEDEGTVDKQTISRIKQVYQTGKHVYFITPPGLKIDTEEVFQWSRKHIGHALPVRTGIDSQMIDIWDEQALTID